MNITEWPLSLFSLLSRLDCRHDLLWNVGLTEFAIICSDVFYWGCTDAERITEKDLEDFERAVKDSPIFGPSLWCARKRKLRPQTPMYEELDLSDTILFNECGPERTESNTPG